MKILVVEDDLHIQRLIRETLEADGHRVTATADGNEAAAWIDGHLFEAAVLDVMVPGRTGFELCALLRSNQEIPILMLTALGELTDKRDGFSAGADDYITKPFDPEELVFRLHAVARRYQKAAVPTMQFGEVTIDKRSQQLTIGTTRLTIPRREFELLHQLASFPGRVFSREELIEHVWGLDFMGDDRTVDVHIKRLRTRLHQTEAITIETVRGLGYRLEVKS
ncbi:two component transcriptional regulator, winged helix family [Exiguobacterium sibiricum 255-15]|uniref:Heme response regulator HssR n=1 Tax=Exiguobacterium sibiricum (strain DSM 17290 / CCUG 55495 / CIP 109462 / JCM 13490 / 255-15) TaxID=262543 RepID=B1YEH2_EXIS2|nr:response regulator transcription factor [Exiguobacterium sibiricum]ACB62140.1 two component transcriptional regulator, winged helix family [Exiguobacterium sibiricum 255-15]